MYCYNHSRFNYFPHPKYPTASQAWGWDPRFHQRPGELLVFRGHVIIPGDLWEAAGLKRGPACLQLTPNTILEAGLAKATYPVYPTPAAAAGAQAALQEGPEATRGHCRTTWAVKIHTPPPRRGLWLELRQEIRHSPSLFRITRSAEHAGRWWGEGVFCRTDDFFYTKRRAEKLHHRDAK